MEKAVQPFEFRQYSSILKSTGKKAGTLEQLRDHISTIKDESLFHHVYQYFLKGHILEYTNDFAQWTGVTLEERALSEQLSNIDPYAFKNISELRTALVAVIDVYLERFPEPREVLPGDEFFFNQTVTFIYPAGITARNLAEFLIGVKYIDASSLYYHFYEARVRLGGETDDFSRWFESALGKRELAERMRSFDLFMHTIEGIRERIIALIEEEVRRDMYGGQVEGIMS
ncbi:MAG: DUF5752 family protein [Alphaproteobacteria bacterium]|uniref:DUF5752 family protein n=1 Tax=Candidatus Nitrobium versatile TaxID=2884831 RepID=A0A953LX11_9BACT|nr:DUF5752 family protein [Candidatus Nitrobium versatile]